MENKKILDLTPEEVEFFSLVYETGYDEFIAYYKTSNNSSRLAKLNELSKKIDKYITDNI